MASWNLTLPAPPPFDSQNYLIWHVRMKTYLRAVGLWNIVETGAEPPALQENATMAQIEQHEEEVAKRYRALYCIFSGVTEDIFPRIMTCKTAKEAWDRLEEDFQGSVRKFMMEFAVLKMENRESVNEYVNRLMLIVNQARFLGEDIPEQEVVGKFLYSVPETFEATVLALLMSKELSKLTIREVVDSLQACEYRTAMRRRH